MGRPLVVAHRGGCGLAPENTLAACGRAIALGADAVEIDVRLTADGQPVLLHDATVDRTTNGHGPLAALDAAAVRALDATARWHGPRQPPEPPPLLADVVALAAGRVALHVELKGDPAVPALLVNRVVERMRAVDPPPLLLSFDWEALALARRLAPALPAEPLLATWPPAAPSVRAALAGTNAAWLGLRYALLTPARAAAIRRLGLRLNVWTVNRTPALARALRHGVDAVTTDRPDRLLRLLASPDPSA